MTTTYVPVFPAIKALQPVKTSNANWARFEQQTNNQITQLPPNAFVSNLSISLEMYSPQLEWIKSDIHGAVERT